MIKKLCLFLLLISMICFPSVLAEQAETYYTDAELETYDSLNGFYSHFGIVSGESKAATTMTKDMLMKHAVAYFSGEATDEYVEVAKARGFLDESADATSLAEVATGEMLAKVMVKGLGYNIVAEEAGGYPDGYMQTAIQLGITKGVRISKKSPITYYTLLNVFENAINTEMLEPELGSEKGNYVLENERTVLSEIFGADKYKGMVTAVPDGTLISGKDLRVGMISIENKSYETNQEVNGLLGCVVEYWVNKSNESELLYVGNARKYNTVSVYDRDMIKAYADRAYEVYKDAEKEKTKKISLADDAYIIYNGRPAENIKVSEMHPATGRVEFIDNDGDEAADVVFIYSFDVKIISFVNAGNEILYFKDNDKVVAEECETLKIVKNGSGNEIKLTGLAKGAVVLLARSENNESVIIEQITQKINGSIESIVDDKFVVNGVTYDIAKNCLKEKNPRIGEKVTFYADEYNRIVAITEIDTEMKYGYFIKAAYIAGMKNDLEVKIFDQMGMMQVVKAAQKLNLNGEGGKTPSDLATLLKAGSNEMQPQLIMFGLNADGDLAKVDTAYNFSMTESYTNILPEGYDDEESFRLVYSRNDGSLEWENMLFALGGIYNVNQTKVVFQVPNDISTADDDDYQIASATEIPGDQSLKADLYAMGPYDFLPDAIVAYGGGAVKGEEYGGVIISIENSINEDGQIVQKIKTAGPPGKDFNGYNEDIDLTNISAYWNDSLKYKADVGDVVYLSWQGNKLRSMRSVLDLETGDFNRNSYSYGNWMRFDYGAVYENIDGIITIAPLDKLAEIEGYQAQIAAGVTASEEVELKGKIEHIEKQFVVYNTNSFRQIQVKLRSGAKPRVITESKNNAYISYKNSPTDYSKIMVYTNHGYVWTMIEYVNAD